MFPIIVLPILLFVALPPPTHPFYLPSMYNWYSPSSHPLPTVPSTGSLHLHAGLPQQRQDLLLVELNKLANSFNSLRKAIGASKLKNMSVQVSNSKEKLKYKKLIQEARMYNEEMKVEQDIEIVQLFKKLNPVPPFQRLVTAFPTSTQTQLPMSDPRKLSPPTTTVNQFVATTKAAVNSDVPTTTNSYTSMAPNLLTTIAPTHSSEPRKLLPHSHKKAMKVEQDREIVQLFKKLNPVPPFQRLVTAFPTSTQTQLPMSDPRKLSPPTTTVNQFVATTKAAVNSDVPTTTNSYTSMAPNLPTTIAPTHPSEPRKLSPPSHRQAMMSELDTNESEIWGAAARLDGLMGLLKDSGEPLNAEFVDSDKLTSVALNPATVSTFPPTASSTTTVNQSVATTKAAVNSDVPTTTNSYTSMAPNLLTTIAPTHPSEPRKLSPPSHRQAMMTELDTNESVIWGAAARLDGLMGLLKDSGEPLNAEFVESDKLTSVALNPATVSTFPPTASSTTTVNQSVATTKAAVNSDVPTTTYSYTSMAPTLPTTIAPTHPSTTVAPTKHHKSYPNTTVSPSLPNTEVSTRVPTITEAPTFRTTTKITSFPTTTGTPTFSSTALVSISPSTSTYATTTVAPAYPSTTVSPYYQSTEIVPTALTTPVSPTYLTTSVAPAYPTTTVGQTTTVAHLSTTSFRTTPTTVPPHTNTPTPDKPSKIRTTFYPTPDPTNPHHMGEYVLDEVYDIHNEEVEYLDEEIEYFE